MNELAALLAELQVVDVLHITHITNFDLAGHIYP